MDNQFLIQILKDHLNNQPTVLPDNIDLSSLITRATKQNLEGIVYYQTKIPVLQKNYASAIYNYTNRRNILDNLEAALQRANINYFIVKGFSVASLYPQPQLRTMGDCDIVVHTEDRNRVHEILLSLGADCTSQGSHEWMYYLNQMEFEIHDHLIYEDSRNPEKAVKYFDTAWDHVEDNALDWDFHFMFLLYHLRKHIMGSGAGIRQFMDLAAVINNIDLNWDRVREGTKYLEIEKFFERVLSLLKYWFDIEILGYDTLVDWSFAESVTHKILYDGVFGFADFENKSNILIYDFKMKGRFYQLCKELFLSYDLMITMEEYSFIEGKKFLLPIGWIYRIILKWKDKEKLRERYFISSKKINSRIDYLKQWGLE